MRAVVLSRYLTLLGLAGCAAGCAADATPVAETTESLTGRPAAVPSDYVITPAGYFHPSCVNTVADGEQLRPDGKIQARAGGVRSLGRCAYPHFNKAGAVVDDSAAAAAVTSRSTAASATEPTINGWVEQGDSVVSTPLGTVSANWQVPTAPFSATTQTLYYFPGLEDINNVVTIVQPVLGWFSGQWTLASWDCCVDGNVNHSNPIVVNSGDWVFGSAQGTNCTGGVCANWSILSQDQSTGQSTTLATSGHGQSMNWAFGGVLEVYDVSSCQQYPASAKVPYTNIQLKSTTGTAVTTTWNAGTNATTPACGNSVTVGTNTVTVGVTGTVPSGRLTPAAPTTCGRLNAGQGITAGQNLTSCDGRFNLAMQLDGNLVVYQGVTPLWSDKRFRTSDFVAVMQSDGNFVVYDLGSVPRFASNTSGNPGAYIVMQPDGNLVVYSSANVPLWASNTCCH